MVSTRLRPLCLGVLALGLVTATAQAVPAGKITLTPIGRYSTGFFAEGGAEIVAYDAASQRMFVVNAAASSVDVVDLRQPANPLRLSRVDATAHGASANSVAVHNGVVAVAIEAENKQAAGVVAFYDTTGRFLNKVTVGALPDMVTFSPDGRWVVVANEGEPLDYCQTGLAADPEGTVAVIDMTRGAAALTQADVRLAGFTAFNGAAPAGVRIFGPNATVAQDLEPEYVTVSADSTTAYVTLQENNALAVVDLATARVTSLTALGTKDHSKAENGLDASDRDDEVRIRPWPVMGMFQPDAIASYRAAGSTYLVTANEGDARDYECFGEEERIADVTLDPATFPNAAELQTNTNLGRLRTTTATGDTDGDGDVDQIHTYGARSVSIWGADGSLVWDSGKEIELVTASLLGADFNSNNDENDSADSRSDDKGPEPEAVTVGEFRGRQYAFVGLERIGGVIVFDVSDPRAPHFVTYANPRDFAGDAEAGTAGDLGPEGLVYVPKEQSPIPRALLLVANEVSGTVTVYSVKPR